MRIAVVGFGVEGRAALAWWGPQGDVEVRARDVPADLPAGVAGVSGPDYLAGLDEVDLIVRSPGVRPDLLPPGVPTTTVVEEFLARCPAPVIGVTGTQGKGTTCTVATAILQASGRRTFLGGNIGTAPLAFLAELTADDVVVLELSNFQLVDLHRSPQVAVVLPVTPDHLNWHTDLAEYHAAKTAIAAYQSPADLVVFDSADPVARRIAAASPARPVPLRDPAGVLAVDGRIRAFGTDVMAVADVPLRGAHNVDNVVAAVAATWELVGGDVDVVRAGVATLRPLPNRLQPVARAGGVVYVNDSLSTTPVTTRAAVAAYPEPKVLVLGGSSKNVDFAPLGAAVAADPAMRRVLLVGQDGPRIAEALAAAGFAGYEYVPGPMAAVVARAAAIARPGDAVLLSPACASFDQYRDYADRGAQFTTAALGLPGAEPLA